MRCNNGYEHTRPKPASGCAKDAETNTAACARSTDKGSPLLVQLGLLKRTIALPVGFYKI